MDFVHVVCTVVIYLSDNNRDVVDLHGSVVQEVGQDYLMVDFSREFFKRHYDPNLQPGQARVLKVKWNSCLYETKNKTP